MYIEIEEADRMMRQYRRVFYLTLTLGISCMMGIAILVSRIPKAAGTRLPDVLSLIFLLVVVAMFTTIVYMAHQLRKFGLQADFQENLRSGLIWHVLTAFAAIGGTLLLCMKTVLAGARFIGWLYLKFTQHHGW